jgi:hypothetical protein
MNHLLLLMLIISAVAGTGLCAAQESEKEKSCADPLTVEEVSLIGGRLPRLKPGMSRREVFEELGDGLLDKVCIVISGGSSRGYWYAYQLRGGYNLILIFDRKAGHEFKSAEKAGEEWPCKGRDDQQKSHNRP